MTLSSLIAPINWHFWINQGSGNANYYFATILLFSTAQVLLLAATMNAYLRSALSHENPSVDISQAYQR